MGQCNTKVFFSESIELGWVLQSKYCRRVHLTQKLLTQNACFRDDDVKIRFLECLSRENKRRGIVVASSIPNAKASRKCSSAKRFRFSGHPLHCRFHTPRRFTFRTNAEKRRFDNSIIAEAGKYFLTGQEAYYWTWVVVCFSSFLFPLLWWQVDNLKLRVMAIILLWSRKRASQLLSHQFCCTSIFPSASLLAVRLTVSKNDVQRRIVWSHERQTNGWKAANDIVSYTIRSSNLLQSDKKTVL